MPNNKSSKGSAKKVGKRQRKSCQENCKGKRVKLQQSNKQIEECPQEVLQRYLANFYDASDEEDTWKINKNFFRAPEVIKDNKKKDPEDEDSKEEDDDNNDTDDDFTNGGFEKLVNATVVEVRAVPEYQESEEETDEETYSDTLTFDMDDSEDEEQETDDGDEDDQESPVDSAEEHESDQVENSENLRADGPINSELENYEDSSVDAEALDDTFEQEDAAHNGKESGNTQSGLSPNPAAHFYAQPKAEAEPLPELSIFENSLKTNKVLAVLKQDMEWYGTVIVTLLSGRISINGYEAPQLEPLTIYSPKGFNWVVISPLPNKKVPKDPFNYNNALEESFSRAQLENILSNFDRRRDAIVLLQRNSGAQKMLNNFATHMAENVFPLINATNRPHYASEYLLNCLLQRADDQEKGLQVPRVWTKLKLLPHSRVMITGGKGVGKSTLLRYLLNRHLPQFGSVLLLDLDIGQPEMFVPQTVSCSVVDAPLLGPGFFLNRQPDKAFVVGHANVVMCAEQYAHAVKSLLLYCQHEERYKDMLWLINTMGYNKGFGVELMALLVDAVKPTSLVQISSRRPINNFDVSLDSATLSQVVPTIYVDDAFKLSLPLPKYAMHKLESVVPKQQHEKGQNKAWRMSAKDMRYSNILARLSATLRGNAKHLTECQPLKISLDELQFLQLTSDEHTREELIAGAEVNMVYLCKAPENDTHTIECLGIGVVRAVDYETKTLYLLPAMPLERCADVKCLVIGGDMCLPQGFIKDQGASVTNNVPFVFVIDDSKSSKSVQQIYHRAPGFLGNPANKNV
ncbi:polynucleotide 5'-hydroxyl-kinase NOL9 [Drosophila sulfurigaster albostrigata]|uniref:polynucleotide 5'-hydroxyl-kinase NOL9 n=1 Tax=Drosophila sulfurigaster albostrigata TaxID=89887 RepID=UPI002D218A4E|nr:polynucleotide 5'-hydroxyl-kinase NOL9 [Drosophila sulfurigaster albostrigata]